MCRRHPYWPALAGTAPPLRLRLRAPGRPSLPLSAPAGLPCPSTWPCSPAQDPSRLGKDLGTQEQHLTLGWTRPSRNRFYCTHTCEPHGSVMEGKPVGHRQMLITSGAETGGGIPMTFTMSSLRKGWGAS